MCSQCALINFIRHRAAWQHAMACMTLVLAETLELATALGLLLSALGEGLMLVLGPPLGLMLLLARALGLGLSLKLAPWCSLPT